MHIRCTKNAAFSAFTTVPVPRMWPLRPTRLCMPCSTVEKGKVLGYVGSTGNSTGNHLHLEMKVNNVLVNVMNYLS